MTTMMIKVEVRGREKNKKYTNIRINHEQMCRKNTDSGETYSLAYVVNECLKNALFTYRNFFKERHNY